MIAIHGARNHVAKRSLPRRYPARAETVGRGVDPQNGPPVWR